MDGFLSALLFVGLFFLMMRFGCGAHMGHGRGRHGDRDDQAHTGHPTAKS